MHPAVLGEFRRRREGRQERRRKSVEREKKGGRRERERRLASALSLNRSIIHACRAIEAERERERERGKIPTLATHASRKEKK